MSTKALRFIRKWSKRVVVTLTGIIIICSLLVAWLLNHRASLDQIDWPMATVPEAHQGAVTATWLGVTTILFDDGETQLLIDGFISRPSLADIAFRVPVESDAAQINYALDRFEMRRLAAVIPVHSHFDHAMDVGAIANRTSASILGSETTAQIARGASVPEDQIVIVSDGKLYQFGEFSVRIINSLHAPIGWSGSTPLSGEVQEPLLTPAPVTAWREGRSYTVVVAHPEGTTIVQGSAGFLEGALNSVRADVVMLGTFGLDGLGNNYTRKYWQTLVTQTGARRVFPIHFDDYTQPFGVVKFFPTVLDDFVDTAELLEDLQQIWDVDTRLQLPEFGKPIVLYPADTPEA